VEPGAFDAIVQKLSRVLSRRSLMGGSLGASVLTAVGLGNDVAAKNKKARSKGKKPDVRAEDCIKTGKRCPARRVGGKHKHGKLGCDRCCQGRFVTITNAKGKQVNKCACKPEGEACSPDRSDQCCNGVCQGGTCGTKPSPPPPCNPPSITCNGQCVNPQTDPLNCGECRRICPPGTVCNNGLACQGAQCVPVTESEGCVTTDPQGGLTISTGSLCPSDGYGAFAMPVPTGTTLLDVTSMRTGYEFSQGVCEAGSPRFVVVFEAFQTAAGPFINASIPPSICTGSPTSGNSGELVNNNEPNTWNNQGGAIPVSNYNEAIAAYGTEPIAYIFMIADQPSPAQTVTVTPCITLAV